MDGRDYAVVPIVALVAGVVNGELVTADELSAFVAAWNGRPVPLRHPQDANGPISANSPSVIEGSVVGQVFKMAMEATGCAARCGSTWRSASGWAAMR